MPDRDIRAKIKLEGEQQFKSAMKGASDAIKVLNSEQKLAQAQFEATGDKEKLLADTADILRRKIEEQQKAVKAAEEAVQKLREKGVDPNNKSMQDWTTKLNNSRAYLTRLEGQLNSTESELSDQGRAFGDAADGAADYNDQLDQIGQGVDFANTITSLDAIQSKLDAALNAVVNVAASIYDAEIQAAKWADDLTSAATKAGLDIETYQSWEYAANFIDTNVDTIIKAQDKLLMKLRDDSDETALTFNRLGIVTKNSDGTLRDHTETFWDVIDALGKTEDAHGQLMTETEKDAIAQELFGRSYRELIPLIESGRDRWNELTEEGREFATVSAEDVEKLNALNDANDRLNARLETTKKTILASMAPAFAEATDRVSGMVDAFNSFLQTEEGQRALENLNDAVDGLLSTFITDDFEGVLNAAANAVRTLTDVLSWISEYGWTVVGVLAAMKLAVGGITITKTFLQMLQLMKSIQWLNMGKGAEALGKAAGGGAAAAGAGGAAAGSGGLLKRAGNALKTAGGTIASAATAALPYAAVAAISAAAAYAADKIGTERNYGDYNRTIEQYDALMAETADERITALQQLMDAYRGAVESEDAEYGGLDIEAIKKTFADTANQVLEELPDLDFWKYVQDAVDTSDGLSEDEIDKILGLNNIDGMAWYDLGTQVVAGLADGIAESSEAADAAADMAQGIEDAVSDTLDMHSPSQVLYDDGVNVAQGLADGINARAGVAIAAAQQLAAQVDAALNGAQAIGLASYGSGMSRALSVAPNYGAAGSRSGASGGSGVINNSIYIDGRQMASVMTPYVSRDMSMELRAQRR